METIFVCEQRERHPLKPMRIWKRMSDSFHKVAARDSCSLMTDLQSHAMTIPSWELDDLTDWIKKTESLRQDYLKSASTADDCIVCNLLDTLVAVPSSAPFHEDWKFTTRTWKSEHDNCAALTWLVIKSCMQKDVRSFLCKRSRDEAKAGSLKKPKVSTPAGMALVATKQLTAAAKSLSAVAEKLQHCDPPVRTRN
eukprot:2221536-Rhodomonas_salina.1